LPKPTSRTTGSSALVLDGENVLGGKAWLQHLTQSGDEQAHAHGPEHEPLADERHHLAGAAAPCRFGNDRDGRKDEHQQDNGHEVHRSPDGRSLQIRRIEGFDTAPN
jgi:hypothetical protein